MSKYAVNIECILDVPDDEFNDDDDPIAEIKDDLNYFIDAFQAEYHCSYVEKC